MTAGEEEKGPPQRPVCGAVVGSNYRISHFISSIIRPVIEEAEEPCNSTKDFLSTIQKVNNEESIGSMDVEALYPKIDIEFSVDKCVEMTQKSEIQFNHINFDELGLYLVMTVEEEILTRESLQQYCPTRKKRGKRLTITGSGSIGNEDKR